MKIEWWNTNRLVERLANDEVLESEAVYYAMVASALYSLTIYYSTWFGGSGTWLLAYEFFVVVLIGFAGVNECFKANGGPRGKDFLKRLAVLGVPVGIKVTLVSTLLGQMAFYTFPFIVTFESFRNPGYGYELFCFAFVTATMVVYYWRLSKHISRLVRRLEKAKNAQV